MAYQLTWEENGTTAYFSGSVNDQELREIVAIFYGHEQFDSIRYLLINFLDVNVFNVTEGVLKRIGAMDYAASFTNPNVKVAIVLNDTNFQELFSSYEEATEKSPWPLRYFANTEEARIWLSD